MQYAPATAGNTAISAFNVRRLLRESKGKHLSNAVIMLDSARDLGPEFIVTFLAEKCECHKISSLFWQKSVNMAIFKILAEKCECQKNIVTFRQKSVNVKKISSLSGRKV